MGWMKKAVVGAASTMMMFGCTTPPQGASAASGSLALSMDDSRLYATDTDNGVVSVIDTKTDTQLYNVKVGTRPFRVVVGKDDTLYVANRGSRSVSVIRSGEQQVAAEIPTGVDPTGLAISGDGKTLYVVSATAADNTDYGTLQAVDTATLQPKYEKGIGYEPRAIALISDTRALVTTYRGDGTSGADLVEVNLTTGEVTHNGGADLHASVNKAKLADTSGVPGAFSSFKARAMTDVVVTPDGNRAFVPTVWAREDAIARRPSASGGYYSLGGPCNVGAVATAGIVTVETGGNTANPKADDLTDCVSRGIVNSDADYPPTALGTQVGSGQEAVQGPSAVAVDPTGEWLFMVNKETSNLAVMPVGRRTARDGEANDINVTGNSFRSVAGIGDKPRSTGADGIALTKDGTRAYVYSQFDHKVSRFESNGRGPQSTVVFKNEIDVKLTDTLSNDMAIGRRNFFDAMSTTMSSEATHVACATCHLEGREDAHVWAFPDGKRQTPALVGRGLSKTGPLHWTGEFKDFGAFMSHTVISRMGGQGVSATLQNQISSWLENEPAPENANVRAQPTDAQTRGQVAFAKANCNSCHVGAFLTDSAEGVEHDVGTIGSGDFKGLTAATGFDTPSLRGLARSAPYLHDGTAGTLMDRLNSTTDKHGDVSKLSTDEKADLVEYLKTL